MIMPHAGNLVKIQLFLARVVSISGPTLVKPVKQYGPNDFRQNPQSLSLLRNYG